MSACPAPQTADIVQARGSPADAVEWLEDQLAGCNDQEQALRWCALIDAAEAFARGRVN